MFIFKPTATTYVVSGTGATIFGGLNISSSPTARISLYDGTRMIRASAQLAQGAYDAAAGSLSGASYVFGGNTTGTNSINSIQKYDAFGNMNTVTYIPFTIRGAAVAPVSGFLYTMGGDTGTSSTVVCGNVSKFDGSTSTTVGTSVLGTWAAYASAGNIISTEAYLFGGNTSGSGAIQKYTGGFSTSTMSATFMTTNPFLWSTAASPGTNIYLFGGTNSAQNTNSGISSYNGTTLSTVSSFGNIQKDMSCSSHGSYISLFGGVGNLVRRFTIATTTLSTDSATLDSSLNGAGLYKTCATSFSSIAITK